MEEWLRGGLKDGDVSARFLCGEFGNDDPDEVAGFSFDGALEQDAIFVGRPMEDAETDAETDEVIGGGEVANFQHFSVDEVRHFRPLGETDRPPA